MEGKATPQLIANNRRPFCENTDPWLHDTVALQQFVAHLSIAAFMILKGNLIPLRFSSCFELLNLLVPAFYKQHIGGQRLQLLLHVRT